MGASDGYVVGTTKVVDHGPDNLRWNLVIVGDGYQASELANYHTHVQNFITTLRGTPPFDELYCGINVHRIDVVSTDSGADDPGCGGNPAVTVNTYFDSTFCSMFAGSPLERLLTIDSGLALSVATGQVPLRHQVLCIVNSTKYGGSGGSVATASVNASASQIAIHEMGHSAFGLADEYGGNGSGTPAGEPLQPNVTRDTNRATNKWRTLIAATTPMPSQCDGTCTSSTCVPPASPPPAGAVGTYEGAIYSDCNTYRPLPSCYMRDYGPFCPVCTGVIRTTLQPFQPAEVITLVTPSISFTNVPAGMGGVGVTTYRAIRWDVVTCRSLTFEITVGPTGGFGTPQGASVTVTADSNLPTAAARIWLSYTSTNAGDTASGSVTVRCVQTGQSWTININANTIARPRSAVSLVIDRSGSMNDDAGDGITKVQKLREAANVFINIMLPGDGIGLVRFNDTAQRLMEITDVGASPGGAGRTDALNHIAGSDIDPSGATSIGDGIVNGRNMLNDAQAAPMPDYDVTAMVVLTDGMWNRPPSLADVAGSINANTYAVGLGIPSNISVPALTTLCQGHAGYLLVTGALTTSQSMLLSKYFLQILAGVTNAQIAADPSGVLVRGAEHRIPFWITEADYGMDVIVLSPAPCFIDFQLETPDGSIITPASGPGGANSQFVPSQYASYYRCALPVLPANANGSQEGLWYAVLRLGRRAGGNYSYDAGYSSSQGPNIPYEMVAHTYSSLTFSANVTQTSYEVGATAVISAALLEYDAVPFGRASVWAEIRRPDGSSDAVALSPAPGERYAANYSLAIPGLYAIHVRARGETVYGRYFEREQTLTAVAVPGGDHWNPNDPPHDTICEVLDCLRRSGAINDEFLHRLKKLGFDLQPFLRCLQSKCRGTDDKERPAAGLTRADLSISQAIRIITEALTRTDRGPGVG
ncbi:M64 family metallopeptidase [Nitrococcus mobilis]|uniref:von Willebrand factor, type A n=1 Tax=Nitrococcus mobilis Nb-231 TaxID=314278 RepID=A4BN90_9GAMM|nr:M64 family metallopeptidase [Nitrococcus mobilis]EAR22689.1 von Willebrand factor, type A [Nitrococcus mobilis Nb-231]